MTVYYKISPVKSHFDPEGKVRYIARPTKRIVKSLKDISKMISERTSASRGDVVLVLHSFVQIIPELLKENYIVQLEPLGIFSLSYRCKAEENPEDITHRSITEVKIQFRPDNELKEELVNIIIRKAP